MVKISLPVGRYFLGDVAGLSRPWVAIPARASVFYSDDGDFEIEIAGGASTCYDENAFGVFGVIEFEKTGLGDDDFEGRGFEITSPVEVEFDFDFLNIPGVACFSVCRDAGLTFTDSDDDFDGE